VTPEAPRRGEAVAVALALAALTAALLAPVGDPFAAFIGDPGADTLRGVWGLDHLRRSVLPPDSVLFSAEVQAPMGAWALILPFPSALLAALPAALLGPVAGWNAFVFGLLWAGAFATASLARLLSGSWAAGLVCGGVLLGQPAVLVAVADGTAEHIAFGLMALALAGLARSGAPGPAPRAAVAAVVPAAMLPLESPYLAVCFLVLALPLVPGALAGLRALGPAAAARRVALAAGLAVLGAAALAWVFGHFPGREAESAAAAARAANSVSWERWPPWAGTARPRDPSLVPNGLPGVATLATLALALAAPRRAGGFLLVGLFFFLLAFGGQAASAAGLEARGGGAGRWLARAAVAVGETVYTWPGFEELRFPRRLLGVAALAWSLAAALAWGRWAGRAPPSGPRRRALALAVGAALAAGATAEGARMVGFHRPFPRLPAPVVAAADWIATQPPGIVAPVPRQRASDRALHRHEQPVFAGLDASLRSTDLLYLQVRHGRPQTVAPSLLTLRARAYPRSVDNLLHAWDDLTLPRTVGRPLPPSSRALAGGEALARARDALLAAGLRYLLLDDALFEPESLALLRESLGAHLKDERTFPDGTGLRVLVVAP